MKVRKKVFVHTPLFRLNWLLHCFKKKCFKMLFLFSICLRSAIYLTKVHKKYIIYAIFYLHINILNMKLKKIEGNHPELMIAAGIVISCILLIGVSFMWPQRVAFSGNNLTNPWRDASNLFIWTCRVPIAVVTLLLLAFTWRFLLFAKYK